MDPNLGSVDGMGAIDSMAFHALRQDQLRFNLEISYQMKLKMNDKLYMEKRQHSDYVKPARSENVLYRE